MGMGIRWDRALAVVGLAGLGALVALRGGPVAAQDPAAFQPCDAGQEVADAFTTEGFQVWICRAGDDSLTYRGLGSDGRGIVLPATADGQGGYDAGNGSTIYHVDPQRLLVTDGTVVLVDQAVTARPATGEADGADDARSGGDTGTFLAVGGGLVLLFVLYWLPTIWAFRSDVPANLQTAVLVSNLLFGWTIFAWILCMVAVGISQGDGERA